MIDKRIQLALGGFATAAVIAVVLVIAFTGGEDSVERPAATTPAVQTTDLEAAAKLAGATFTTYDRDYGSSNHVTTPVRYPQNPPTNGPHHPDWADDGNYAAAATPPTEQLVHALEHGRIEIQYRPGLPQAQIDRLLALYEEAPQHVLLFENATGMKPEVAATAWGHGLLIPRFTDSGFDAIRAFRDRYVDKGPELVP